VKKLSFLEFIALVCIITKALFQRKYFIVKYKEKNSGTAVT